MRNTPWAASSATCSLPSSPRKSAFITPTAGETDTATSDYIAHLDGFTEIPGGWLNHNYIQLAYQLADCVAGFSYSFAMTCIILLVMNLIPGLSLRVSAEEEMLGLDDAQLGEFAYDYVELARTPTEAIHGQSLPSSHGSIKETKQDGPEGQG